MTEQIPSPRGYPLIGNLLDIDPANPTESLKHLADLHGPIFKIRTPAERIWVSGYSLARELFDEKRFEKAVSGPLGQVRNLAGDGLFTAYNHEHAWQLAHRLLMPAFGPLQIKDMFSEMQDITAQMVIKWARYGPEYEISAADDFTRLTLDSIAICAMGDRFNSFYHEEQHPFVQSMVGALTESFARSRRLPMTSSFYAKADKSFQDDIDICINTAKDLLAGRRARPNDRKDLLNAMINAKDSKTGEKLSDPVIIRNMVTFLIAGHETTSGLLSFLFYCLLENPSAYRKVQEEVDTVIGKRAITAEDTSRVPYIEACLREALRLYPTAPAFSVHAKGAQIIGGKYMIKDGETVSILLPKLHRDADVYGDDAEDFRPERMYMENFTNLPPDCWKPFGNGKRGCIGRSFAWQEAVLAVATLFQTFHFTKANPDYQLKIQTALTIKPKDFYMKARLRDPEFLEHAGRISPTSAVPKQSNQGGAKKSDIDTSKLHPLDILYGSNTGTSEALAQALAAAAPDHGFTASVKDLDSGVSALKKDIPVVIYTASYEGLPPENAGHFVEWIGSGGSDIDVNGVSYAVFGLGNKDWASTYQKIPKIVDESLSKAGASRLVGRSEVNVANEKVFDKHDEWQAESLWPALAKKYNITASRDTNEPKALDITVDIQKRSSLLRTETALGEVTETTLLTRPGAPRKRHIGIRLPSGVTYRAGDYLAVLPINAQSLVKRVLNRFNLPWDAMITIDPSNVTSLPKDHPVSVYDLIAGMVELQQPVSSRTAVSFAKSIPDENAAKQLEAKVSKGTQQSLLGLLEQYPDAQFSFPQFLAALPVMRLRQYSISSSPLNDPTVATLTYSIIDAPNKNGGKANFTGVCTTYLERLEVGDRVQVSLKPSRAGFHLPADNRKPIIMACAGTGLAPFRAFVQERAARKAGGAEVGPALLFYGLNAPDEDDMYREEFAKWEQEGVVSVRRAFTFKPEASYGAKFVQERIWHDRKEVAEFYRTPADVYLCGAGIVGQGVEKVMAQIRAEETGEDEETARKWVADLKGDRYWSDVFA